MPRRAHLTVSGVRSVPMRRHARTSAAVTLVLFTVVGTALAGCAAKSTDAFAARSMSTSSPTPTPSLQATPEFPVLNPGGKVDAASQHTADTWLAGAVVPPGAVRHANRPSEVADGVSIGMWCTPMADAVGYWTVPGMSPDDAMAWLEKHPSHGMLVTGGSGNVTTGNATNPGGSVVDEPQLESLEAMIFTVTASGSGSGIRADAFAKAADSVCAAPLPGTHLGIGG